MTRTFAIIPAAGKSTRMGRPKLSLPLAGSTVLQTCLAALTRAGLEHILVVVGPHVPELEALASQAGAQTLLLDHDTPDMRATLMLGLRRLRQTLEPSSDDRLLVVPADHPTLDPEVVRRLLAARADAHNCSIVVPTFQKERGHPVLLDWEHVAKIEHWPPDLGLNSYLRSQAAQTLELPVDSPTVLFDLDTPEDYEELLREYNGLSGSRGP